MMSKLLSIFTIYFVRYFSVHFSCIHVMPQLGNCANMGPAHLFKADSGGSFVISCSTQKHDEIPAVYARVSSNIKVVSFVGSKRSLAAVRPQEANSFVCIALQGTDVIPPNAFSSSTASKWNLCIFCCSVLPHSVLSSYWISKWP